MGADESNCNLTIGYMPSLQQVCAYVHEGVSEAEELDAILKLATEYCLRVQPIAQLCLQETIENTLAPEKDNKMDEWIVSYSIKQSFSHISRSIFFLRILNLSPDTEKFSDFLTW